MLSVEFKPKHTYQHVGCGSSPPMVESNFQYEHQWIKRVVDDKGDYLGTHINFVTNSEIELNVTQSDYLRCPMHLGKVNRHINVWGLSDTNEPVVVATKEIATAIHPELQSDKLYIKGKFDACDAYTPPFYYVYWIRHIERTKLDPIEYNFYEENRYGASNNCYEHIIRGTFYYEKPKPVPICNALLYLDDAKVEFNKWVGVWQKAIEIFNETGYFEGKEPPVSGFSSIVGKVGSCVIYYRLDQLSKESDGTYTPLLDNEVYYPIDLQYWWDFIAWYCTNSNLTLDITNDYAIIQ